MREGDIYTIKGHSSTGMCKIVTIRNPLVRINPVTDIYNENILGEFTLQGKKYYVDYPLIAVTIDELIDKIIL